jgi:hypothetical protein
MDEGKQEKATARENEKTGRARECKRSGSPLSKYYNVDALATHAPWIRNLEYIGIPPSEHYTICI